MLHTADFIKRLEKILDYYSLSASAFSDKIGVQRSSLSHLLSGRNKPSLDFILKIVEVFPNVDLYWILNGFGSFPKNDTVIKEKDSEKIKTTVIFRDNNKVIENQSNNDLKLSLENVETPSISNIKKNEEFKSQIKIPLENDVIKEITPTINDERIEKIVFFYTNGKFTTFDPK